MPRRPNTMLPGTLPGTLLGAMLLALGAIAHAAPQRSVPGAGPAVTRPTAGKATIIQLGVVAPGQRVVRVINVLNARAHPVTPVGVISGCVCARGTLPLAGAPVLPQGHYPLVLHLVARLWPGREDVLLRVRENYGGKFDSHPFMITYRVENYLRFPSLSWFIRLASLRAADLPAVRSITVRRGRNAARWDRFICRSDSRWLTARVIPLSQGRYRLRLRISDPQLLGPRSANLRFVFKSRGKTLAYRLTRPVWVRVVGPIRVDPSSIIVLPGSQAEQHLTVKVTGGYSGKRPNLRILSARYVNRGGALCPKLSITTGCTVGLKWPPADTARPPARRVVSGSVHLQVRDGKQRYQLHVACIGM